jgi:hypothetical protein
MNAPSHSRTLMMLLPSAIAAAAAFGLWLTPPARAGQAVPRVLTGRDPVASVYQFSLLDPAGQHAVFAASEPGEDPDVVRLWRLDGRALPSPVGTYSWDLYSDFPPANIDPNAPPMQLTQDGTGIIVGQSGDSATVVDVQSGAQTKLNHSGRFPALGHSFVFATSTGIGAADFPGAPARPLPVVINGQQRTTLSKDFMRTLRVGGNTHGATGLCHYRLFGKSTRNDSMAIISDVTRPAVFHTARWISAECELSADGTALTSTAVRKHRKRYAIDVLSLRGGHVKRIRSVRTVRSVGEGNAIVSTSPSGRFVILGRADYAPESRARLLVDVVSGRVRRLRGAIAPLAWSPDDRKLVAARGARLVKLNARTGKVRILSNAKTRLPGTFRDRTNSGKNPPRVSAFTSDGRAVIVIVEASSNDRPYNIWQFGVRVPLDGSAATALPRAGEESFEDIVFSQDGTRALLITSFGAAPVRELSIADANAGSWTY